MRVYILSHSCGGPGIKGNIFIGRSRPDGTTQHSCAHVHTDYGEVKVYLVKRWRLWMALGGKEYVCLFSLYVFPDNILDPVFALQGTIPGDLEMISCFLHEMF